MFYQVLEERQFEKRASLVLNEIAYLEKAAARQDLTAMEKVAILKQLRQAKGKLDDLGHRAAAYGSTKLMQRGIDPFEAAQSAQSLAQQAANVAGTGGNPLVTLGVGTAMKGARRAVKKNKGVLGKSVRKIDNIANETAYARAGGFGQAADSIHSFYGGPHRFTYNSIPQYLGQAVDAVSGAF